MSALLGDPSFEIATFAGDAAGLLAAAAGLSATIVCTLVTRRRAIKPHARTDATNVHRLATMITRMKGDSDGPAPVGGAALLVATAFSGHQVGPCSATTLVSVVVVVVVVVVVAVGKVGVVDWAS